MPGTQGGIFPKIVSPYNSFASSPSLVSITGLYIALIHLKRDHVSVARGNPTLADSGILENTKLIFSNLRYYSFCQSDVSSNYG
jgi:hypothetical protein